MINYRQAAFQTFTLLEQTAAARSPYFTRASGSSVRRYVEFLIDHKVVHKEVGRYYVEKYEHVQFSDEELSESEYRDFMKVLSLVLKR